MMMTFKQPIDALVQRLATRLARGDTPDAKDTPATTGGAVTLNLGRMECAPAWVEHPSREQFAAVAASAGPFPELRVKDL